MMTAHLHHDGTITQQDASFGKQRRQSLGVQTPSHNLIGPDTFANTTLD
ncbi:hypothetical protein PRUB_a2511 [Pseudoalteromonas rubra]|uniref:Uncharacterized protein n=1 Tax=Pseudoalteromonas rubra TaxID=43658 RepID=A0A8T0CD42_9GAMM|nr:hypothetical protein PRUB_a2511 [Pseudoalteromonas rubra]